MCRCEFALFDWSVDAYSGFQTLRSAVADRPAVTISGERPAAFADVSIEVIKIILYSDTQSVSQSVSQS